METRNHLEPQEGWGTGDGESFARLQSLLALVREENRRTELSPERREQLRERVMARVVRNEVRRRRRRAVVVAACAAFAAAFVATLVVRARAA